MFKTSDLDLAAFLWIWGNRPSKKVMPQHAKYNQYVFEDSALQDVPKYSSSEFEKFAHARIQLKHLPLTNETNEVHN